MCSIHRSCLIGWEDEDVKYVVANDQMILIVFKWLGMVRDCECVICVLCIFRATDWSIFRERRGVDPGDWCSFCGEKRCGYLRRLLN